jgi:hypothetical protein
MSTWESRGIVFADGFEGTGAKNEVSNTLGSITENDGFSLSNFS